ncbi:MAG: LytTR family transcriptional regulator [Mediterranea sp.]|nr:LytTR family transcriptional regulator [Mediterranea sp.]
MKTTASGVPLFIRDSKGLLRIFPKNILYIKADENYCTIHLIDNKTLCIAITLRKLLEMLQEHNIIRIHKTYAVNRTFLQRITSQTVVLSNQHTLKIGEKYKETLFDNISIIGRHKTTTCDDT